MKSKRVVHIGDVIENSIGWHRDVWDIPGVEIMAMGERVREWSESYDLGPNGVPDPAEGAYYGGWPSANLPTVGWGGVVSTSLLLEEQVVGKDPISDWFSLEQYDRDNFMASRTGWLRTDQSPAIAETRQFLAVQVPAIKRLRPLLDLGIVRLVPSERLLAEKKQETQLLASTLTEHFSLDSESLTEKFQPGDLPIDDDLRGMFVFASQEGDAERLDYYLRHALRYFSCEFMLAVACKSTYTAVFPWEDYLVRQGLGASVSPLCPPTQIVFASHLPIFANLTPEVLAGLHQDDGFAQFRADLASIYGSCPMGVTQAEAAAYALDREKTVLRPFIDKAERDVDRGPLARLGLRLASSRYSIAGGLVGLGLGAWAAIHTGDSASAGLLGGAPGVLGAALDCVKGNAQTGSQRIWSSLVQHGQKVGDEIPGATLRPGNVANSESSRPWGLPPDGPLQVTVTDGTALSWQAPRPEFGVASTYSEGAYVPCPCGSRRKFRFCCAKVPGAAKPI